MADWRTLKTLGPFDVGEVDDGILSDVVYNQGVPIIVKQNVNGVTKFAVVAKDRELRIVCAGCFSRTMNLANNSRCRTVCSFVKHWDKKDGERRQKCMNFEDQDIETKAENTGKVILDFTVPSSSGVPALLENATDDEIFSEIKRRGLERHVAERMTEDELIDVAAAVGVWPIIDARPTRLIHELRRQAKHVGVEAYYHNEKRRGSPHCTDEIGADILEKTGKDTRQSKKNMAVTHFPPRSVTDYR